MNPASAIEGVLGGTRKFINVDFWTNTALPLAAGYLGTRALGGIIYTTVGEKLLKIDPASSMAPWAKVGADILSVGALSYLVGRFGQSRWKEPVFLGGVLSIAISVLKLLIGGTDMAKAIGLEGLGDDGRAALRADVAQRVAQAFGVNGLNEYLTDRALQPQRLAGVGVGEFLTDRALTMQPSFAPLPGGSHAVADYDPTSSDTVL